MKLYLPLFFPTHSTTMQAAPAFLVPLEGCLSQREMCFGQTLLCARVNLGLGTIGRAQKDISELAVRQM